MEVGWLFALVQHKCYPPIDLGKNKAWTQFLDAKSSGVTVKSMFFCHGVCTTSSELGVYTYALFDPLVFDPLVFDPQVLCS